MNCKVCGNTSAKNTSVSFFRFPKENSKCRDWADRCDLLGLFEKHGTVRFYKSFRICSQHFDPKDVVFDGRKNKLLQSATPRLSTFAKNPSIRQDIKNFNSQLSQNLCRLCAEENDNVTDIFGWRGRLLNLESKLKYFPQVINKHDILPLKICNDCVSKVNHFYDFIISCTRAETKLRAMLTAKDCNSSSQLTKSDMESDEKVDWYSGMETSLNKTPKIINSPNSVTYFSENMTQNYYNQVLMDSFIGDDDGACLSKGLEGGFPTKNHMHGHTNFVKIEFSNSANLEHDYSNVVPKNQLQLETEMQTALDDQSFIQETKFSCDVCLESFQNYEALKAHALSHSEKWDLHRECLNELYDEVFGSRLQFELASGLEDGKYACKVCDEKSHGVAFLDNHSFGHQIQKDLRFPSSPIISANKYLRPCQSRRESKSKVKLKRFLKIDQTKSSFVRELDQTHSKLERQSCRFWEKLLRKRVRSTREKTQTEESHQCTECGKFFRSKASLRQHKSVHSEKRIHNCQECGMSFKRKDTLCNHRRIHTGERPFMCKVCGFAFKQRGDCMKHEKNHSKYRENDTLSKGESLGTRK